MKKTAYLIIGAIALCVLLVCFAPAQEATPKKEDIKKHAGYVNISLPEIFDEVKPKVEVKLEKPMLQMLKAAAGKQEPEFGKILDGIKLVRVNVFPNTKETSKDVSVKINKLVEELKAKQGWSAIVHVEEKNETVDIMIKMTDNRINGLTLFVQKWTEIVFVNIVTDLDAEEFGQKMGAILGSVMKGQMDFSKFGEMLKQGAANTQPNFEINGVVKDAETGKPIQGAKIMDDGYGPEPRQSVVTDAQGKYTFKTWNEEHNIIVQAQGYKSKVKTLTPELLQTENGPVIDIELDKE